MPLGAKRSGISSAAVKRGAARARQRLGDSGEPGEHRAEAQAAVLREQFAATAEILRVISKSPADVQPVFDTIMTNAVRLCEAPIGIVTRFDGEMLHLVAAHDLNPAALDVQRRRYPMRPDRSQASGRALLSGSVVRIEDILADPEYDKQLAEVGGWRRLLAVPMLREGRPLGVITLAWADPGPVPKGQEELLQTFADQAVIAIENVRLFKELEERNSALAESLEQQMATSAILRVIAGSPTDLQPVLDTVAENAARVCGAKDAQIFRIEGGLLRMVASYGRLPALERFEEGQPINRGWVTGRAVVDRRSIHVGDLTAEFAEFPAGSDFARRFGHRTTFATPLLREGAPIGAILIRRAEARPFTERQIKLLETFADQAVIAIENVRLFHETREMLERQTATAEILKVISSSPTDVQPVFDAIVASAVRLVGGYSAALTRRAGDDLHLAAFTATGDPGDAAIRSSFPMPSSRGIFGKAIRTRALVCCNDTEREGDAELAGLRELGRARGWRSIVVVPLVREAAAVGTISVTRREPGPFSAHHLNLLKTFADQAVIAIENVRLFNELKARNGELRVALEQQTATSELLKVIGRSTLDLQPVFETLIESAVRLCEAERGFVWFPDGEVLRAVVLHNAPPKLREFAQKNPVVPGRGSATARAALERRAVHIPDALADPEYTFGVRDVDPIRTALAIPVLRGDSLLGVIAIYRLEVRPFSEDQIALMETFADQAVIAIENVRLFKELQARTEALTRSVGQLTALSEVGQAISSSLELETVLKTIVQRALQLSGLDACEIFEYDEQAELFRLRAAENLDPQVVEALGRTPMRKGEGAVGRAGMTGEPAEIPDILDAGYQSRMRELLVESGYRGLLAVPLLRDDRIIGALAVQKAAPGPFAPEVVELLKTFATQSALAIQNARLFREIAEKSRQLEEASRHKSRFLASMSHELRTPLNAILGFNEMMLDGLYGELPADLREPLEETQKSGKHLLRLINNVLDLAKIEAGRMELALAEYSVQDTVEAVRSTLRPLAAEKGLEVLVSVPEELPLAYGDPGRITQCLMNLAGNSLKFTRQGKVEIAVREKFGLLRYSVSDTGIGIPADKIESLFTEFKQTDATIASEYGGTGLGLSITRKFVEMHGGRIWAESEPGNGSVFTFEVPLRVGS